VGAFARGNRVRWECTRRGSGLECLSVAEKEIGPGYVPPNLSGVAIDVFRGILQFSCIYCFTFSVESLRFS
jgi:hypothetical protein